MVKEDYYTMNKSELIKAMAEKSGLSQKDAGLAYEAFIEAVTDALKDGDKVSLEIDETNLGEILVFTNQFNAYKLKIHEIPDTKLSNFGEYLPSLLEMEPDEVPVQLFTTGDYKGFFLFVFEHVHLIQ